MAENQLTPDEAHAVSRVLRGAATTPDDALRSALGKLAALEGADPPAAGTNPYVGLVVLNSSGVPEVVCGEVALVDFNDLEDASHNPRELEQLADAIETDLGDPAVHTISDLRELAQDRRVQHLEDNGKAEPCSLPALQAAIAGSTIDPDRVTLLGARVDLTAAARRAA